MWTTKNRARYDRSKLHDPSDVTDAEWVLVEQGPEFDKGSARVFPT